MCCCPTIEKRTQINSVPSIGTPNGKATTSAQSPPFSESPRLSLSMFGPDTRQTLAQMLDHCRGIDSIVELAHLPHSGVNASSS